ncbi:MAG TPA: GGDEF domain-containing protein [Candidatus Acidoferrales bacterium]|nr:GGDEF domain-containing protein [Candidatus Acidoferrales bacterium]
MLDGLVTSGHLRIVSGFYLPTFLGIQSLGDDVRSYARNTLNSVFKALQFLYRQDIDFRYTFSFEEIVRTTQTVDHLDENDVLPALVLGEAFDLYYFQHGLHFENERPSTKDVTAHERILDFASVDASWSAIVEQTSRQRAELSIQAQKPSRLNLPTKDALLRAIQDSLNRREPFAVLMIDLDNFKSVNDTNGHPAGDACLDSVVNTLADVVGRKGKLYRWGSGDEFVVLLPDFFTDEAKATAERIRRSVEHSKPGGDIAVSTSIGVCGTDHAGSQSAEEILDFADKAVYESKHSGKNRVTTWPLGANATESTTTPAKPTKKVIRNQLAIFLKEAREIQNRLHYSNPDSLRQKQEWEQRVEKYLEESLDQSYSIRFQNPGYPVVTYPEGINAKMMAPWAETGARMTMLNNFMAELRD